MEKFEYFLHSQRWALISLVTTLVSLLQSQATPSSPYPHCTGEYLTNLTVPEDALFEVLLSTTLLFNQSEVDIFLMDLDHQLQQYCDRSNSSCTASMDNVLLTENPTIVYQCSLDATRLILGLVYSHNEQVVSTTAVLSAIEREGTCLRSYFLALQPTQRRVSPVATTTATTDVYYNFTNVFSDGNGTNITLPTGLTRDQIVWVGVGVSVSTILVSVLSGVLGILSLLSKRKAKLDQKPAISIDGPTPLPMANNFHQEHSPVLVSGGPNSKNKDLMPPGDL